MYPGLMRKAHAACTWAISQGSSKEDPLACGEIFYGCCCTQTFGVLDYCVQPSCSYMAVPQQSLCGV